MATRRQQLRAELTDRIKSTALDRLQSGGPAALTMRGIASDLGLSPGALYRYVAGIDELITDLLTESYLDMAAALESVHRDDPLESFAATCRAYRRWAIEHPHRFSLLFGDPIPAYAAPLDGPTTAAMNALSLALFRPLTSAMRSGVIAVPESYASDAEGNQQLIESIGSLIGFEVPTATGPWAMATWATIHGLVVLELNGQFRWVYGDDAGPQFDAVLTGLIDTLRASVDG